MPLNSGRRSYRTSPGGCGPGTSNFTWVIVGIVAVLAVLTTAVWSAPQGNMTLLNTAIPSVQVAVIMDQRDQRQFREVRPGYVYRFPFDHGSHPEFATEWWYVTGHLRPAGVHSMNSDPIGFQVTFFRTAVRRDSVANLRTHWALSDLFMAHFALTDPQRGFHFDERLARPGPGHAKIGDLDVGCEDWSLIREAGPPERLHIRAGSTFGQVDLACVPLTPPVVHGHDGIHLKGACDSCGSHYVSLPRLAVSGALVSAGVSVTVTGTAWFDHEFFSGGLPPGCTGWDWMGLHLSDGSDLMVVRLRGGSDRRGVFGSTDGTFVEKRGRAEILDPGSIRLIPGKTWISPITGGIYPVHMGIEVPAVKLHLEVAPVLDDQELQTTLSTQITYWEGLVRVKGIRGVHPVAGWGYLEMTGYAGHTPLASGF